MTKPNNILRGAPDAVFRIWYFREKIEVEAAHAFKNLGNALSLLWGEQDTVAKLSFRAYDDEMRHKKMCRAILDHAPQPYAPVSDHTIMELGPRTLSLRQRALYAAVAMGCITESLSSALLLEMQCRAEPALIKDTVHSILRDEITHARIGWAELARAHANMDVSFLKAHLHRMLSVAFASDIVPMLDDKNEIDLSPWGILTRADARKIMNDTVKNVIVPGLKHYGLELTVANADI